MFQNAKWPNFQHNTCQKIQLVKMQTAPVLAHYTDKKSVKKSNYVLSKIELYSTGFVNLPISFLVKLVLDSVKFRIVFCGPVGLCRKCTKA
jgi:hypothetical protein